jgi:hypothetical protein
MFHPRDEAFATPKLNCASIDEASGLVDGFVVVSANQRFKPFEVAIGPDGICSVIGDGRRSSDWCNCRFVVRAVRTKWIRKSTPGKMIVAMPYSGARTNSGLVLLRGSLYFTFSRVSFALSKITSSGIAISARIALQQKIIDRLETGSLLTDR